MPKNKKTKYFFRILSILFFIYIALIIAFESGYYETKNHNRTVLTKNAMEEFESDLEQGKVMDIKEYLKEEKVDYSNKVTKIGNKVSNSVNNFMTKGLSSIFNTLKDLFW